MSDTISYGIAFTSTIFVSMGLATMQMGRTVAELTKPELFGTGSKGEAVESRIYSEQNKSVDGSGGTSHFWVRTKHMFTMALIVLAYLMIGFIADPAGTKSDIPQWRREIFFIMLGVTATAMLVIGITKWVLEERLYKAHQPQNNADVGQDGRAKNKRVNAAILEGAPSIAVYTILSLFFLAMLVVMVVYPHTEQMVFQFDSVDQDASRGLFIGVAIVAAIDMGFFVGRWARKVGWLNGLAVVGTMQDRMNKEKHADANVLLRLFSPMDSGVVGVLDARRIAKQPLVYLRTRLTKSVVGTTLNVRTPDALQYAVYGTMLWFLMAFYNSDIDGAVAWLIACGPGILMTLGTGMPDSWMEWFFLNQMLFWSILVLNGEIFTDDSVRFLSSRNETTGALSNISSTTDNSTHNSTNNWVAATSLFAVVFMLGVSVYTHWWVGLQLRKKGK